MAERARSHRSARTAFAAALAALGLVLPAAARAQSFPADAQWVPVQRSSAALDDAAGDGATGRDVVGSAAFPAVYFYGDGSFVYFRLRINDSVLQSPPANFKAFGWVCLVDLDNDLLSYELSAGIDGITDLVQLRSNTGPGNTGSPGDTAETLLQSYPAATHAREVVATSTFGNNPDVFIDWAVSLTDFENSGAGAAQSLRLVCGSSSNAQSLTTDFVTSTGATTLEGLSSDPVTCNFSGCTYACAGLGEPCTTGVGACEVTGVRLCSGSSSFCDALPGEPGTETCNGIDDDCDGEPDQGFGVGTACSVGIGACETTGALVCDGRGGVMCDVLPGEPTPETCNGVDDDCDGEPDQGFDLGAACSVGIGACESMGELVCDAMGGTTCSATPGAPAVETCNGLDDDCNGAIDEICVTCSSDGDCGGPKSGTVCDLAAEACIPGCRGAGGNVCPDGRACTSTDTTIGACVDVPTECSSDGDCGGPDSGRVCDLPSRTCTDGCRGAGGNVCPPGFACSSETGAIGTCAPVPALYFEGNGVFCGVSRAGGSGPSAGALAAIVGVLALRRRRRAR
ncbi:MopE-related protein [Polyangium aurulentum]|uniref:MopE-related protein n=1 Tax=Polyangium aurulentum TaxID=2567896 RepID=UPI00146E8B68|nr:MopE-related protein [Polyangium aurulentum]UQA59034.1 hypothetical protein E8A73_000495 [Polyangium aurulentum]